MTMRGAYGGSGSSGLSRLARFDTWCNSATESCGDGIAYNNWTSAISSADNAAATYWTQTTRWKAVSVPLCTSADADGWDIAGAAAGSYDTQYQSLCTTIKNRNVANLILRPGWEFNGGWYPWGSNNSHGLVDASRPALFVAAFQRFVGIARATLPDVLIDWNCTMGSPSGIPTYNWYPGDAYVDIVGMDLYNVNYNSTAATDSDATWWTWIKTGQTFALDWLDSFGTAHGKYISFPEWGTGRKVDGGVDRSRDSAYFVQQMAAWIKARPNVLYHNYFHYPAGDGQWPLGADIPLWTSVPGGGTIHYFPNASSAYLTAFGVL